MSLPAKKTADSRYTWRTYAVAALYFSFYGVVKYLPPPIGDVTRFAVLKLFLKRLKSWKIKDAVSIWFPEGVSIGHHVTINEYVFIDGYGGVEIGDHCRIAHGCSLISEDHEFDAPNLPIWKQGKRKGMIILEGDVWLGAGVRVLKGVRIGHGSIVGAGSVVTRDIPPMSIAVGNPARVVRRRGSAV